MNRRVRAAFLFEAVVALTSPNLLAQSPPSIAAAFSPGGIQPNGVSTLTITISNPNASTTLGGVAFIDSFPTNLVVAPTIGLNNTCGGTATATSGSGSLSLDSGSIPGGSACTVAVNVTASFTGTYTDTAGPVTSTTGGGLTGNSASATLAIANPPTISKLFLPSTIGAGDVTLISFTIQNPNSNSTPPNSDVTLTGMSFTDSLPAGLVVANPANVSNNCEGTLTAVPGSNAISLTGGTIGPAVGLGLRRPVPTSVHAAQVAAGSCFISLQVTTNTPGTYNNTTGAISANESGPGAPSNTATLTVIATAPPSIAKVFNPNAIPQNSTTTLTFTITNPPANTAPENGVAFTDTLPTGLTVPSGSAATCGGTLTTTAPNGIALSGATIAANGQCQFSVVVTGASNGVFTNTSGAVSSLNGGIGNPASAGLSVYGQPVTQKLFGAPTIPINGTTTLTLNITNPNAGLGLTGIGFTDNLPAGLVVAATPGLTNTCGGTAAATAGASVVSLSGGALAGGGSCSVSLTVQGTTAGSKTNSTSTTSTEAGAGSVANATIAVVSPPVLTKSFGTTSIPFNGSTSLTFTVQNSNATVALTNVGFADTFPAGLVVSTPNGLTGSCGGGTITATAGAGAVSLSGATVAAASQCTFSVNVTGTTAGGKTNTTGAVTSTEGGTGGTATASLGVGVATADVSIVKTASAPLPYGGQDVTYTLAVTNAGPQAATAVTVIDNLPAGSTFVSATPNICTGAPALTCSVGTLNNGASTNITVVITTPAAGGSLSNTAAVSATEFDPNTANNASTATVTLAPASAIPALSTAVLLLLAAALGLIGIMKLRL